MRKDWRAAWYERHPEGLVGRLRELVRTRPEAAHALVRRLERAGWGGLGEDLQAPRALCKACDGSGLVWAHPLAKPWEAPPELADEWWRDCPECKGEGLVPFPITEWEEVCPECGGEGEFWVFRRAPDYDQWEGCEWCGGLGRITRYLPDQTEEEA